MKATNTTMKTTTKRTFKTLKRKRGNIIPEAAISVSGHDFSEDLGFCDKHEMLCMFNRRYFNFEKRINEFVENGHLDIKALGHDFLETLCSRKSNMYNVTFEIGWQRDTEHTYTLLYTVERKATEYISSYKSGMKFVLVYND